MKSRKLAPISAAQRHSAPRRIELEISYEGNVIAAESFTPEYATLAPNGEECGPVCQVARIEAAPIVFE